jgi:hypothetical protein
MILFMLSIIYGLPSLFVYQRSISIGMPLYYNPRIGYLVSLHDSRPIKCTF